MYIAVRSIDFAVKAISIDVARSIDNARFAHLTQFLNYCAERGFKKIDIRYPSQLPTALFLMLQDLQKTETLPRLTLSAPAEEPPVEADGHRRITCNGWFTEPGKGLEYRIAGRNLGTALDDLTLALLIVASSVPLDEATLAYARLCLYELAANTVEHGKFEKREPELKVRLLIDERNVYVEYSDNGEAFPTSRVVPLDIAEKIRRRSKRGLGLAMLRKMADRLEYERVDKWNCTKFTIGRKKAPSLELNRRIKMNDLSIIAMHQDAPHLVVLKLSGSINSSTVPQLDAAFNEQTTSGRRTIVLDLSATEFISSSGVGLLIGTASHLRDMNGDLVFMNLPKLIDDIFDVLNIKMHFRIIKDLSELKAGAKV
jgi:anti-sigma B factor antagonist